LTWGASLLTTVALPRLLGADALGQLTIAITIAALAGTTTGLGVSEYLVRRAAQSPATIRQDAGVALLVQMIPTVLGAGLLILFSWLGWFTLIELPLLSVAMLILLITPAQTVLLSSFRGREKHAQYAWFNAAGVVAGQILGWLALLAGGTLLVYAAIVAFCTIATTLVAWKLSGIRPVLPPWGPALFRTCREFVWRGLPFWTWMLTLAVTGGADRVLLGMFVPAAEVGWYAAAYRIFAIPVFLPTLIMTPLFPALSRSVHAPETIRNTIAQTLRIVLLLMVPMTAGILVVAPAVPTVLRWPEDFSNSIPMMMILSLQLPIIGVDMVFGAALLAIGRQGPWVTVSVLATLGKLLLDCGVIQVAEHVLGAGGGAIGASAVSLVSEFAMLAGAIVLMPKNMLDLQVAYQTAGVLGAGVVTVLVGSALLAAPLPLSVGLPLAIVGGATAYLVMAFVLRALTIADMRLLTGYLPMLRRYLAAG
jgi:O-antigen/teichoic acid export membrane protein